MNSLRAVYLYFASRRRRTAAQLRWHGPGLSGGFEALDDAAYCLDRPDPLEAPDGPA